MEIINPLADFYTTQFSGNLDAVIQEVASYTNEHHPKAHMLSGSVQGKFLEMLSCMIKPSRVLEIGTFTGFSALCLSKGLSSDGVLHTIEIREEDAKTAASFFEKAGMKGQIQLHIGTATDILPALQETWDLVFIDADKVSYIDYYELTLPKVKTGGWVVADNVLFHGEVLEENISGKNPKAIHAFNQHVANDNRVDKVMLTVRDGLTLIRKL